MIYQDVLASMASLGNTWEQTGFEIQSYVQSEGMTNCTQYKGQYLSLHLEQWMVLEVKQKKTLNIYYTRKMI